MSGGLTGGYKINRARPSFHQRLMYFGLDRAWSAAMEEADP
jgi:pilus assembly protein CpaF